MRKIRLEPDTLGVESFIPSEPSRDGRGTVDAHDLSGRNCPATVVTRCVTNCECTFSCPTGCTCTQ